MVTLDKARTPWHLWVIGVVTLIWNGFGANDYTQSQLNNREYLEQMTGTYSISVDEMLNYINAFPAWADAAWAIGVWGSVLGSLLLLLRSRFAMWAFVTAALGAVGTTIYQFSGAMPAELYGVGQIVFAGVIWIITLGLIWYSKRMTDLDVLR